MAKTGVEVEELFRKTLFGKGINTRTRVITLNEGIEDGLFGFVDAALALLEGESGDEITIRLSSYGGSIYELLGIIDRLQASPCTVNIDIFGYAMSAGAWIATCGATGKRRMAKHAWFMYHTCNYGLGRDTHRKQRKDVKQSEREMDALCKMMGECTKKPYSYWKKLVDSGDDHYFTADEALSLGCIDEII